MKQRLLLCIALGVCSLPIQAQGCAQCRDNMQSAPESVQRAYRHAIELLAVSGLSVFAGGVILLRRYR